ncbi:hypothetical protein QUF74_01050 [Candidatus Halobeggiatoa sp. HSG11]|nr:hypothetical protein [Candidatus Halobeggiatoa sp. HSG11]
MHTVKTITLALSLIIFSVTWLRIAGLHIFGTFPLATALKKAVF